MKRFLLSIPRRGLVHRSWTRFFGFTGSETTLSIPEGAYSNNLFRSVLQNHSKKVAIIDGVSGAEFTYSDLIQMTNSASSFLTKFGIGPGRRVLILAYNSVNFVVCQHAVLASGAVLAYCNPASTCSELIRTLKCTAPDFIFTESALLKAHLDQAINSCAELMPKVCLIDQQGQNSTTNKAVLGFDEVLRDSGSMSLLFSDKVVTNAKTHLAYWPMSSGTTGLPKVVQISHYNLNANMAQVVLYEKRFADMLNFNLADETCLIVLPFYHIYNAVFQILTFYFGGRWVILPHFDPKLYFQCIQRFKITTLQTVPPLILFLLNNSSTVQGLENFHNLRRAICAAAPLNAKTEESFVNLFPSIDICQGYGLSETSPITHWSPPTLLRNSPKRGTIGLPVVGTDCKIVECRDSNTELCESLPDLGANKEGELWVKGPQVMLGYKDNEQANKCAFTSDNWFRTGDIAVRDEDGYYFVVDRLKELIKYKGFQVAPAELEAILLTHPDISDVAVISKPDARCGELPLAVVTLKTGTNRQISAEEIQNFVAGLLSKEKHLHGGVLFADSIPKTASGKILRREVRAMFAEGKFRTSSK